MSYNVFLGIPLYSPFAFSDGAHESAFTACLPGGFVGAAPVVRTHQSSLLPQAFNQLWADAVTNEDYGVFAMLHGDVMAIPGWLDILVEAMVLRDADVVSAAVRIKDNSLDYSTGIDTDRLDKWSVRRLNAADLDHLPKVYSRANVVRTLNLDHAACGALLLNTGCWVANLAKARRKWAREVTFTFGESKIWWDMKRPLARTEPEDWSFSRQLFNLGVQRVFGTTLVRNQHLGHMAYDSHFRPSPQGDTT